MTKIFRHFTSLLVLPIVLAGAAPVDINGSVARNPMMFDAVGTEAVPPAGLEFPEKPIQKRLTSRFYFAQGRLSRWIAFHVTAFALATATIVPSPTAPPYEEFLARTDPNTQLKIGFSGMRSMGQREDKTSLDPAHRTAYVMNAYLYGLERIQTLHKKAGDELYLALIGDPRPSGDEIREALMLGLTVAAREKSVTLRIENLRVLTTPLAESAVRALKTDGGAMITASHNPLKDNGVKFMTAHNESEPVGHGALLSSQAMDAIAWRFKQIRSDQRHYAALTEKLTGSVQLPDMQKNVVNRVVENYLQELKDTFPGQDLKTLLKDIQVGVDANGGAGSLPVDGQPYGLLAWILTQFVGHVHEVECAFGIPGHGIEPVGDALEPLKRLIQKYQLHFGIATDYDADRATTAPEMEYQEVAAFNVMAALAKMDAYHLSDHRPVAIVVHDATSRRVEEIAQLFDRPDRRVIVRRVETGEVNVVAAMQQARREGYYVPIGVEGANGGTVLGEATCRDAIATALLTAVALADPRVGEMWAWRMKGKISADAMRRLVQPEGTLHLKDLVATLPTRVTPIDKIVGIDNAGIPAIKATMEGEFLNRWETDAALRRTYASYRITRYEGTRESQMIPQLVSRLTSRLPASIGMVLVRGSLRVQQWAERIRGDGMGGWAITLRRHDGQEEFLWLRPSRTEPLVRYSVDALDMTSRDYLLGIQIHLLEVAGAVDQPKSRKSLVESLGKQFIETLGAESREALGMWVDERFQHTVSGLGPVRAADLATIAFRNRDDYARLFDKSLESEVKQEINRQTVAWLLKKEGLTAVLEAPKEDPVVDSILTPSGSRLVSFRDKDFDEAVAADLLGRMQEVIDRKGFVVVTLCFGNTPSEIYRLWRERYQAFPWDKVVFMNGDEYLGLGINDKDSARAYFEKNIVPLTQYGLKHENVFWIEGTIAPETAIRNYKVFLQAHGGKVDIMFMGIAKGPAEWFYRFLIVLRRHFPSWNPILTLATSLISSVHVYFDEAGSSFDSELRVTRVSLFTRVINKLKYMQSSAHAMAITVGLRDVREAAEGIIIAKGSNKWTAIDLILYGAMTTRVPATVIQYPGFADHVTVFTDESATPPPSSPSVQHRGRKKSLAAA